MCVLFELLVIIKTSYTVIVYFYPKITKRLRNILFIQIDYRYRLYFIDCRLLKILLFLPVILFNNNQVLNKQYLKFLTFNLLKHLMSLLRLYSSEDRPSNPKTPQIIACVLCSTSPNKVRELVYYCVIFLVDYRAVYNISFLSFPQ